MARPRFRYGPAFGRCLLFAVVLLSLSGCGYYNTFYFAKKYYSQAERLRETGASEDLLPPEAVKKYDQSIVQCRKVLTFHEGSRWVDDALFLMGASYYGKAEYDSALVALADLERNFPKSKFIDDAIFTRGLCRYEQHEYELMREEFDRVLDRNEHYEQKDDLLYTLAQTAEKQEDRETAIRRYRDLVDSYPGTPRGEDGLLAIGRLYFEAEDYDNAMNAYDELVRRTKSDEHYQEGQLQLAQALIRTGRAEEAADRLEKEVPHDEVDAQARGVETDYAARIRISLAQAKNRLGEHEEAVEVLRVVTEKYPSSTYACEAQYLIGYTFESYLDSLASAEVAYDAAAKMSSRSSFREIAKNRLINLRRIIAQGAGDENSDTDLEQAADAALKIAELQYFAEQDLPGALVQYRKVIEEYPTSSVAARANYAIGWIYLRDPKAAAPDTAFQALRETVERFPASKQARSAITLLAEEGADTTGLHAMLVEPEPERPDTTAVPIADESDEPRKSGRRGGADRAGELQRRLLEEEGEGRSGLLDSLRLSRFGGDSLGLSPDEFGRSPLDSLGRMTDPPRSPADSLDSLGNGADSTGIQYDPDDTTGTSVAPITPIGLAPDTSGVDPAAPDEGTQDPPENRRGREP